MSKLIEDILRNDKSVREIIEDAQVDLLQGDMPGEEPGAKISDAGFNDDDKYRYTHLFVRRYRKGDTDPYKRSKVKTAAQALVLWFDWVERYKNEKVEIWTDGSTDAKKFYRYVLNNRESFESYWRGSRRLHNSGMTYPNAYHAVQSRLTGHNDTGLTGSLYPFVAEV